MAKFEYRGIKFSGKADSLDNLGSLKRDLIRASFLNFMMVGENIWLQAKCKVGNNYRSQGFIIVSEETMIKLLPISGGKVFHHLKKYTSWHSGQEVYSVDKIFFSEEVLGDIPLCISRLNHEDSTFAEKREDLNASLLAKINRKDEWKCHSSREYGLHLMD